MRVVMNAWAAAALFDRSCQPCPMSAHENAPISSQASRRVSRSDATTRSSMAATNPSIRASSRVRPSSTVAAAYVSTGAATAGINTTMTRANPSTATLSSRVSLHRHASSGSAQAATKATARAATAAPTAVGPTASGRRRSPMTAADPRAGRSTRRTTVIP